MLSFTDSLTNTKCILLWILQLAIAAGGFALLLWSKVMKPCTKWNLSCQLTLTQKSEEKGDDMFSSFWLNICKIIKLKQNCDKQTHFLKNFSLVKDSKKKSTERYFSFMKKKQDVLPY